MTVLRGCAFGASTDEPYAPLVRALRPALAALPDAELSVDHGQRDRRAAPAHARAGRAPRLPRRRQPAPDDGAGAPPGAPARGDPRRPRASRRAAPDPARDRGPAPRRRRDPHARRRSSPGSPAPSAWRSSARTRPMRSAATTRGPSTCGPSRARPRQPDRLTLGPLGRDDLARLIESIEGERAVGQRPRRGGRAVGWPPARGRGAPGRPARAADGLADVHVRGPGPCPDGRPLDRDPARASPAGPGRPAAVADHGRRRRRGVRGRCHQRAAAVVERAAPGRRGPRCGSRRRARGGPGARVRDRERGWGLPAPRAGRAGRRGGPAAVGAHPPPCRPAPGPSRTSRSWRCTTTRSRSMRRPPAGSPSRRRIWPQPWTPRPTSWPPSSWRSPRRERPGRPGDLERPVVPRPGPRPPKASARPTSRSAPPKPRSPRTDRSARRPTSMRPSGRPTPARTGPASA